MVQLKEFNKPDYANMSPDELKKAILETLGKIEKKLDKSFEQTNNGYKSENS